jgi:hypothetical protein
MKANGYDRCYHEQKPDLDRAGVQYYLDCADDLALKRILYLTRLDTFFESSNRLFSLSNLLHDVFPNSRFIHLFRNGYDQINSTINNTTWPATIKRSPRLRYSSELAGPRKSSPFERTCWYWSNYNERILEDLTSLPHINLRFESLVSGNLNELEDLLGHNFPVKKIPPVDTNRDSKLSQKRFESHHDWPSEYHHIFRAACGGTMTKLGYEVH